MAIESAGMPAHVAQARECLIKGQYLAAQGLIPALLADPGVDSQLCLSRLYNHLGARRLSDLVSLRNARAHRRSIAATTDMIRTVAGRRGVWRAWCLFQKGMPPDGSDADRAEWLSLRAYTHALTRDFERAFADHDEAMRLDPDDAWLHVERAYSHELADQVDLARHHAQQALALRPHYRPAVQLLAQSHLNDGRHEQAIEVLRAAMAGQQSAYMAMALLDILMDRRLIDEAAHTLSLCEQYLPLADQDIQIWLQGRHADIAFFQGDVERAIAHARQAGPGFFERLADRLQAREGPSRRVELPVGFVRQHHMTCAPATLAALAQYWGQAAEHLEIAEAICYDGTPAYNERRWCEDQGLVAREFTVDWDTARALLDAGVPFTLGTVATGSAHLQAVIGYDQWRRTLLIRDPSKRTHVEFDAGGLFESHQSSGPRGMLLLPPHEAHRLDGIDLPEAACWDGYHQVMWALSRHDRAAAMSEANKLNVAHPAHRLTVQAWRAMAMYDGHDESVLVHTETLLQRYPFEPNLVLHKASLLRSVGSRAQCEAWWEAVQQGAPFDPVLAIRHVQFLQEDSRQSERAAAWLKRILQMTSTDATAWFAQAGLLWERGQREPALACYRVAACLADLNEHHADTYARAANVLGRQDEALRFLIQRVQRTLDLGSAPVMTLFNQLEWLERTAEGMTHLQKAMARRPQDAELLLFSAEVQLRYGRHEEGLACLNRAEPFAKRASWLRLRAQFHRDAAQWPQALACAREAADLEPLNTAAHRAVATLIGQVHGKPASLAYLREVAARFPHHFELQRLLLSHVPEDEPEAALSVLRHMQEISPIDAWTHRELAFKLARWNRCDEAWDCAQTALTLDPQGSRSHATLGYVRWRQGRIEQARQHMRDAIGLSVDNDYAVSSLVEMATTRDERLGALHFIRDELVRQVTMGDGLLTFQDMARGTMAEEDLLRVLQDALKCRPDLWQAWATVAMQLARMSRDDDAYALFDAAIERFPLLPRLHLEKANALLLCDRRQEARDTFAKALALSPGWPLAVRRLADAIGDEGVELERALPVLASGLQRHPDNADLRALHGWFMWRLGRIDEAFADLRAATLLEPGLRWPWDALHRLGQLQAQPEVAGQAAEALAAAHPGDPVAWLRVAEFASDAQRAMAAIDAGLAVDPRHQGLFETRLQRLIKDGRFDEAQQALDTAPWPQEALPAPIGIFRARLLKHRGDAGAAIDCLEQMLARDPDNFMMWRELADWADEANQLSRHTEAAREMVRIAPHAAVAQAYLGHALRRMGQIDDAVPAFDRAVALDPAYGFPALNLIDICLEAGKLDQAESVLDRVEAHHDKSAHMMLRRLKWAVAKRWRDLAVRKAAAIVSMPDLHDAVYEEALQAIHRATWDVFLVDEVAQAIGRGFCAEPAIRVWLAHQGGGFLPGAFYRDVRKGLANDPGHVLKKGLLSWLGERKEPRLLNRFVKAHHAYLRADAQAWALTGYAYLGQARFGDAAAWMADWRERDDAPGWALNNLNLSLRQLGRHAEARPLAERALQQVADDTTALLWQALDAAYMHDLTRLRASIEQVPPDVLQPYYKRLRLMLQAYADAVHRQDSAAALGQFAQVKAVAQQDRVLRGVMRLLRGRLLRQHTPRWVQPWRWLQFRMGWG